MQMGQSTKAFTGHERFWPLIFLRPPVRPQSRREASCNSVCSLYRGRVGRPALWYGQKVIVRRATAGALFRFKKRSPSGFPHNPAAWPRPVPQRQQGFCAPGHTAVLSQTRHAGPLGKSRLVFLSMRYKGGWLKSTRLALGQQRSNGATVSIIKKLFCHITNSPITQIVENCNLYIFVNSVMPEF